MFGAYCDVVKVAVAADLVEHSVVPRRPQNPEAVLDLAGEDGVGELHGASRRELRQAIRVGMEVAAVPPEIMLHHFERPLVIKGLGLVSSEYGSGQWALFRKWLKVLLRAWVGDTNQAIPFQQTPSEQCP